MRGRRVLSARNATRGALLAASVELAERPRARMRGLLGRAALPEGSGMLIRPCTSIHTFFMKFPIDVLFLDREGLVLRALPLLPPWRMTRIYPRAAAALELWAGAVGASDTREGDRVEVVG